MYTYFKVISMYYFSTDYPPDKVPVVILEIFQVLCQDTVGYLEHELGGCAILPPFNVNLLVDM